MIMIKLWIRNQSKNFYLSTNALKDFIEIEGTVEYDGNANIFNYASNVYKKKITNSIMKIEKLVKSINDKVVYILFNIIILLRNKRVYFGSNITYITPLNSVFLFYH